MESVYYDPSQPGSYGGLRGLLRYGKGKLRDTKDWLRAQEAYTLHKPLKRKFIRRKTLVPGLGHLWQMDLIDLTGLSKFNDGFKYILTIIDCFSRFAYAMPLLNKSGHEITKVFSSFVDREGVQLPTYVHTDKGNEFVNSQFLGYLRNRGVIHYYSESENKASLVERFNRTLKERMWRYFTHHRTYRYVDILQKLVDSYNRSYHSSLKMAPSRVTFKNQKQIFRILYPPKKTKGHSFQFRVGDTVRISKNKGIFSKGYMENWSHEIFTVETRIPTDPPTYKLRDGDGESIKGEFYEPELQKVKKSDDVYRVEKILKTRKKRGKTQHFVKWLGYPSKFNSWVNDLF